MSPGQGLLKETRMQTEAEAPSAATATAAQQILDRHLRSADGFCRECLAVAHLLVRHPCSAAEWAVRTVGHELTARFLTA
jgi:hypothetical protein